jgi:uncharacterized protein (TIGR00369 family)
MTTEPFVMGNDMLERLREVTATASFNRWAGFEVTRVVDGECELRMVWRPDDMGQYAGFLHAGMIAAMLDTACGFAATTTSGLSVLASQFAMNCLAPAVGEEFVAVGRVVKAGRKQIFTSGELFAVRDGERKLVATATTLLVPGG